MDGTVTEQLENACYTVQLDDGRVVRAHLSGKMRMNYVRVVTGDRVTVDLDPNDGSKGRITYRYKR